MGFWAKVFSAAQPQRALRHEFAIGPLHQNPLFQRKARLYYCIRCKWSFLVSGTTVVALDKKGNPLAGAESANRVRTFAQGPCPRVVAFALAAAKRASLSDRSSR
jgi:hypothetical protein